jgi:single-strand DNA-binding protein
MRCEQRRHCAENAAETLTPGMRVIVTGELCQRTYTTEHGRRTFFVLMADEIGPSLRHHTAKMMQMQRIPAGAGATSS